MFDVIFILFWLAGLVVTEGIIIQIQPAVASFGFSTCIGNTSFTTCPTLRQAWNKCSTLSPCAIYLPTSGNIYHNMTQGPMVVQEGWRVSIFGNGATISGKYATFRVDRKVNPFTSFIYHKSTSKTVSSATFLSLYNFTITSFGNINDKAGSAVYFESSNPLSKLTISSMTFYNNSAYSGGAVSIRANSYSIVNTKIISNTALYHGGGLNIFGDDDINSNTKFVLNNYFISNHNSLGRASAIRGDRIHSVQFDGNNFLGNSGDTVIFFAYSTYLDFSNSEFINNRNVTNFKGTGIRISRGKNCTLSHLSFQDTYTFITVFVYYSYSIAVTDVRIVNQESGMGFTFSHNVVVRDVYLHCLGRELDGYSGIYLKMDTNVSFSNILIDKGAYGFDTTYTQKFHIQNVTMRNLWTYFGAFRFGSMVNGVIRDITIANVTNFNPESDGAGLVVFASRNIRFSDVRISNCISYGNGGGIALPYSNTLLMFTDVVVNNNVAYGNGGGVYVGDSNTYIFWLNQASRDSLTTLTLTQTSGSTLPLSYPGAESILVFFDDSTSFDNKQSGVTTTVVNNVTAIGRMKTIQLDTTTDNQAPGIDVKPWVFEETEHITLKYVIDKDILVKIYVVPIFDSVDYSNQIMNNDAENDGGGMYVFRSNPSLLFSSAVITNNLAIRHGGGIVIQNSNRFGNYLHVSVGGNKCYSDGGGVYIGYGNDYVRITHGRIERNIGFEDGGGIFLFTNNGDNGIVEIRYTKISNNKARNGGGLCMEQQNVVELMFSEITGNHAGINGGGMYLGDGNILELGDSYLGANSAITFGGSVYGELATLIVSGDWLDVNASMANQGGGMFLYNSSVELMSSLFIGNNEAYGAGGGMILRNSKCECLSITQANCSMTYHNNTASRGSAIFMAEVNAFQTSEDSITMAFVGNRAKEGATIYWVADEKKLDHPSYFDLPSIQWIDNEETYGTHISTQPRYVTTNASNTVSADGKAFSPALKLYLYDFYGHLVTLKNSTSVYNAIVSIGNTNCFKNSRPYVSGADASSDGVVFSDGVAAFRDLRGYCFPGGSWTTIFSVPIQPMKGITDDDSTKNVLTYRVATTFKQCNDGEWVVDDVCQPCPSGSYSFMYSGADNKCESCVGMEGVESCSGNKLNLKSGYWRITNTTSYIKACPKKDNSCKGGIVAGQQSCSVGYTGPLCDVCAEGYYQAVEQCKECELTPVTVLIIIVVGTCVVLVALISWFYLQLNEPDASDTSLVKDGSFENCADEGKDHETDSKEEDNVAVNGKTTCNDSSLSVIKNIDSPIATNLSPHEGEHCDFYYQNTPSTTDTLPSCEYSSGDSGDFYMHLHRNSVHSVSSSNQSPYKVKPTSPVFEQLNLDIDKKLPPDTDIKDETKPKTENAKENEVETLHDDRQLSNVRFLCLLTSYCCWWFCIGGGYSVRGIVSYIGNTVIGTLKSIAEGWKMSFNKLITRIKIVVATYQVIVSAADVFHVDMPFTFTAFTRMLKFINFNITDNITIDCWRSLSFFSKLLWACMAPLVIIACLILVCIVHIQCDQVASKKKSSFHRKDVDTDIELGWFHRLFSNHLVSSYLNVIFYITYLILPSVTTMIFQAFDCVTVDPNGHDSYLRVDMSVSCDSVEYSSWIWFALGMVFVYPIGIPGFYLICLYQIRDDIQQHALMTEANGGKPLLPKLAGNTNEISEKDKAMEALSFLWTAYEPRFWYWEIIETFRRIMLTAVLSILAPGSPKQNIFGIVLTFIFTKLYGFYRPYLDHNDDVLADLGQVQIFLTFFAILIISQNILDPNTHATVGILLITINMLVLGLGFYFELLNNKKGRRILQPLVWLFSYRRSKLDHEYERLFGRIKSSDLSWEEYHYLAEQCLQMKQKAYDREQALTPGKDEFDDKPLNTDHQVLKMYCKEESVNVINYHLT